MFTSKTYIVAWDELKYNALDVDAQLTEAGLDFLVFDVCTEFEPRPNWVQAEKVRYYGHFYNSLVDFSKTEHDVFIFNAGDAFSSEHPKFVSRIESMMEADEDVWMMAPRMTNDGGDGFMTLIQMSKKYEDIGLAIHINGIYVSLRRELALFLLGYYEWLLSKNYMDFSRMISGHCLDTVYASWTIYNNKKIYRDWIFTMETGTTTSYHTGTAMTECRNVKNKFLEYVGRLGANPSAVQIIYDAIWDKEIYHYSTTYPILKAYPMLEREEDLDY